VGVDVAQGEFHMLIDFIIDSIRSVLLEDADAISRHRSSCHLPRPGHSFHSFRSRGGDNDATEQHGRQIAFKPNYSRFRSYGRIAGMSEVVATFCMTDGWHERADPAAQATNSPLGDLSQEGFEFAERHLDRI